MKKQTAELQLFDEVKANGAPFVDPLSLIANDPRHVEQNKDGYLGVPIDSLQADLDIFFGAGNWWVENQIVIPFGSLGNDRNGNPLAGFNVQIDLVVNWKRYGGGLARYVGTYGGFVSRGNIATATAMAQGMAFKNAAGKIGKRFGRSLNRKYQEVFTSEYQIENLSPEEKIAAAETVPELLNIFKQFNKTAQAKLKPLLTQRRKEIEAQDKQDKDFS